MSSSKQMKKVGSNPRLVKVAEKAIEVAEKALFSANCLCGIFDPNEVFGSPDVREARQVKTLTRVRNLSQKVLHFVSASRGDEMKFLHALHLSYGATWDLLIEETPTVEGKHAWVKKVQSTFMPGKAYEFWTLKKSLMGLLSSIRELLPDNWDALKREGLVS